MLGGGVAWGASEKQHPTVYRVTVPLSGLPPAFDGFTICQLSDMHRSWTVPESLIRRGAALANSLHADMIVLTGDFVTNSLAAAKSCAAALSELRAPHGVYGVLGNHDHWTRDPDGVSAELERVGVKMLTNRSTRLTAGGANAWVCGVDSVWGGGADLDRALADVPEKDFRFLLCHEPDFADEAAARGIPLTLSGHTHGGQVALPGRRALVSPKHGRKYIAGLQRVENSTSWVYTNVGLGVIAPPIRINCPPEVTLMTLVRREGPV
jgi:uncharacterized protein